MKNVKFQMPFLCRLKGSMEEMSRALFCRTQCQVLVQNPCTGWCPSVLCFDACSVNLCPRRPKKRQVSNAIFLPLKGVKWIDVRELFCRTQRQVLVQDPCTGWCLSVLCFDACSVNLSPRRPEKCQVSNAIFLPLKGVNWRDVRELFCRTQCQVLVQDPCTG